MDARINRKFPRTNGRPLEVLHTNRSERKLPFNLHKISISSFWSSCTTIAPSGNFFDLPMRLQVWNEWKKAPPLDTESVRIVQLKISAKWKPPMLSQKEGRCKKHNKIWSCQRPSTTSQPTVGRCGKSPDYLTEKFWPNGNLPCYHRRRAGAKTTIKFGHVKGPQQCHNLLLYIRHKL